MDFSALNFFKERAASLGLKILSVFLIIIGFIFLLAALYVWIASRYSAETALLTISIIIFSLSLISSLFAHADRKKNKGVESPEVIASEILRTIEQDVENIVVENPRTSVLLAALAGFLVGKDKGFSDSP